MISQIADDLYIYCETRPNDQEEYYYNFLIFLNYKGKDKILKLKMDEFYSNFECEFYKILEVPHENNEQEIFHFLVYSQIRVLLVEFNGQELSINIKNFVYQNTEKDLKIQYSRNLKLFFVPNEEYLEIWDSTFSLKIYSIELFKKIKSFLYISESNILIIYDKHQ